MALLGLKIRTCVWKGKRVVHSIKNPTGKGTKNIGSNGGSVVNKGSAINAQTKGSFNKT